LRADFTWPADAGTAGLFLLSVLMAGVIQFFLAYTLALLAFWVLDVSTFIFIQFAFEYLASGHLFPLDLLPAWLAQMLKLTPYPYLCWFPVSVYHGRVTGPELWTGLAIQAAWVVAGYALARHVWARGIRKYSAVGG
jgi:ABC-2 type transport system permease protein